MTKKPKKNHDILYRVFCVINIIFDVCAFLFCAVVVIAYAVEGKLWPNGFVFIALCTVIAWTHNLARAHAERALEEVEKIDDEQLE